jgi:hypothetical protein
MAPQAHIQDHALPTGLTSSETKQAAVFQPASPVPADPKPFICRRPVRLSIYSILAVIFVLMLAWRFIPSWLDPTFEKHIANKQVMVGMTRQQVLQAWGSPYTMNVSHTNDGIRREEWIYEDWESAAVVKHRYLYFEEGNLIGGWYYSANPGQKPSVPSRPFHDEKAMKELSN